jgi:hypothetical protein
MRSEDQVVQPGENNPNISIRYSYKWQSSTDIRPLDSSTYGNNAKLRLSVKARIPVYNDYNKPVNTRAFGFGQMIVILEDMSGDERRPVNFIIRWFNKNGFITSPLQSPREVLNGPDPNSNKTSERVEGLGSGEEAVITQLMKGTRYCTKTADSSLSRTNPAGWAAPSFFEADISRAQFIIGIKDLNEALRTRAAEAGVPFVNFSENPNHYRLNAMNVGIEGALFGSTAATRQPLKMSVQGKNMRLMTITP